MWDRTKTEVIESLVGEFSIYAKIKKDKGDWWLTAFRGQTHVTEGMSCGMNWEG